MCACACVCACVTVCTLVILVISSSFPPSPLTSPLTIPLSPPTLPSSTLTLSPSFPSHPLSDHLLGKVISQLSNTTMSMIVLLLCILISYISLNFSSLRTILQFNVLVLLLHTVFGPRFIIFNFMNLCEFLYRFGWWLLIEHTHLFLSIMIILFLVSLVWPFIKWACWRSTDTVVLDIESRLKRMQDKLLLMEARQNEILRIVKQLKGENIANVNHEE